jgi:ribosomal protein S18 acetylase RimI-like enzyme
MPEGGRERVRVRQHYRIRRQPLAYLAEGGDVYVGRDRVGSYSWDEASPELAFINSVNIRSDWQRKGVGRQLVREMLTEMRDRGIETVELESTQRAVGFWHRMGFYETGDTVPYGIGERGLEDEDVYLIVMRYDMEDFK